MKRHTKNFEDFLSEKKSNRLNEAVGSERFMTILNRIGFPVLNGMDYEFDVDDNNIVSYKQLHKPNTPRYRHQIKISKALKMLNSDNAENALAMAVDPWGEENWNYDLPNSEIERYANLFMRANREYWDDEGEEIDFLIN